MADDETSKITEQVIQLYKMLALTTRVVRDDPMNPGQTKDYKVVYRAHDNDGTFTLTAFAVIPPEEYRFWREKWLERLPEYASVEELPHTYVATMRELARVRDRIYHFNPGYDRGLYAPKAPEGWSVTTDRGAFGEQRVYVDQEEHPFFHWYTAIENSAHPGVPWPWTDSLQPVRETGHYFCGLGTSFWVNLEQPLFTVGLPSVFRASGYRRDNYLEGQYRVPTDEERACEVTRNDLLTQYEYLFKRELPQGMVDALEKRTGEDFAKRWQNASPLARWSMFDVVMRPADEPPRPTENWLKVPEPLASHRRNAVALAELVREDDAYAIKLLSTKSLDGSEASDTEKVRRYYHIR